MPKVAVLLVGLGGATASTAVATIRGLALSGATPRSTTAAAAFAGLDLVDAEDMVFSGWDLSGNSVLKAVESYGVVTSSDQLLGDELAGLVPMPGIRTRLDIPPEAGHDNIAPDLPVPELTELTARQIAAFRRDAGAGSAVVIYLGSPHAYAGDDGPARWEAADQVRDLGEDVPSSVIYALAAARAGAHFVDFTPGMCLGVPLVRRTAVEHGVQLAGRDGSTGQTMMKHHVGELLRARGMRVRGWYSTNVIGNHDGYVLSLPQHAVVKLADKTEGLKEILGQDHFDHHVTIDYVPEWGDSKESWDSVLIEGWNGSKVELRLNWRGVDSMLASAMIFDLVRLLELSGRHGRAGLQESLGFFFKRPMGRAGRTPSELHRELVSYAQGLGEARS